MAWLLQHAATTLTRDLEDAGGLACDDRLHGATPRDRSAECAETLMYDIPKRNRKKMDLRWQFGVFFSGERGALHRTSWAAAMDLSRGPEHL